MTAVTLMLHSSSAGSVSQPPSDPLYVHFVDRNTGKITVFKVRMGCMKKRSLPCPNIQTMLPCIFLFPPF